jgi:hypothetical protein
VLERCFDHASEPVRSQFVQELVHCERLTSLIKNGFGNYVIQRSLKVAAGEDRANLIAAIQKCMPAIQDRKIRKKWEKILQSTQSQEQEIDVTEIDVPQKLLLA